MSYAVAVGAGAVYAVAVGAGAVYAVAVGAGAVYADDPYADAAPTATVQL